MITCNVIVLLTHKTEWVKGTESFNRVWETTMSCQSSIIFIASKVWNTILVHAP